VEPPTHYFPHPFSPNTSLPWTADTKVSVGEVAASTPFRILSDEGLKYLQNLLASQRKYAQTKETQPNRRQPESLRGLSMRSKWANEFITSPVLEDLVSRLTGNRVEVNTMMMNRGHVNYGKINTGLVVDQWHFDSVAYVLVIMVSDPPEEGGNLQLLISPSREDAFEMMKQTDNNPSEEVLYDIHFPAAGYAVFLEGSRVMHHVTPVLKASTDRMTLVNSYTPINPFLPDSTAYRTFSDGEPHIAPWDYARHTSWRLSQQLLQYCENMGHTTDKEELLKPLKEALAELQRTIGLVEGTIEDKKIYVDEIKVDKK